MPKGQKMPDETKHAAVAMVDVGLLNEDQSARAFQTSVVSIDRWREDGFGDQEQVVQIADEYEEKANSMKQLARFFKK